MTLKVWDLEQEAEVRTLTGHADEVTAVAVDPEGRRPISASVDRTVLLWDLDSGEAIAPFTADGPVSTCAFASDALGRVHLLRVG